MSVTVVVAAVGVVDGHTRVPQPTLQPHWSTGGTPSNLQPWRGTQSTTGHTPEHLPVVVVVLSATVVVALVVFSVDDDVVFPVVVEVIATQRPNSKKLADLTHISASLQHAKNLPAESMGHFRPVVQGARSHTSSPQLLAQPHESNRGCRNLQPFGGTGHLGVVHVHAVRGGVVVGDVVVGTVVSHWSVPQLVRHLQSS